MRHPRLIAATVSSILFLGLRVAIASPTWPSSDSDWTALTAGGSALSDPSRDVSPNTVDIVGDSTYPAGYWYEDITATSDHLMFRMRLSDDGSGAQTYWQVLLNTDSDTDVDWILDVNSSGSSKGVFLRPASPGGETFDDVATGTAVWSGSDSVYSRWVSTGANNFGSDTDYFLDIAIPWLTFRYYTGLDGGDTFQAALGSSTTHQDVNKDLPLDLGGGSNVSDGWSDSVTISTNHTPEPATLALFGLGLGGAFLARRRLAGKKKGAAACRAPRS